MISEKRWTLKSANQDKVAALHTSLQISLTICKLLVARGVETYEQAKAFFRPELTQLHDPFLMRDMDKAIDRITKAIANNENILVYGDYDVDGTTSVATVYSFFKEFYLNIDYYIPNRYIEGYGISNQGIDFAVAHNFSLIIALDCGVKSVDKIDYANSKKVDFIIGDHHLPGTELPKAIAVLDPKRSDCNYPYKELSGCGIGFKLIQAFSVQHGIDLEKVYRYLDLVCVSIGSDIVPITGENRILAFHGLHKLNTKPCEGLKSLIELAGIKKTMSISDVVFTLGPRINAAGRIDDAKHAVKVLIAETESAETNDSADILQKLNTERKDLDKNITEHALNMIATDEKLLYKKSTVLFHETWHKGVIGIVASRLIETYYRPTIILTESDGKVTGSARSVKGFDLYEAIYECSDFLIQFGGHKYAAGLTMLPENVLGFTEKFEQVVAARITEDQLIPEIEIDAEILLEEMNPKFFNILQQMAPFGPENMLPVFITKNVKDSTRSKVLKEEHIKFSLQKRGGEMQDGIGFRMAHKFPIVKNENFDICYQIEENVWNDKVSLQLMVKDIRTCQD